MQNAGRLDKETIRATRGIIHSKGAHHRHYLITSPSSLVLLLLFICDSGSAANSLDSQTE